MVLQINYSRAKLNHNYELLTYQVLKAHDLLVQEKIIFNYFA